MVMKTLIKPTNGNVDDVVTISILIMFGCVYYVFYKVVNAPLVLLIGYNVR